ncbi:energy transducer TonB [Hymenobacter perfusus]|uniref:TonB C-terminal domain-containing protein n=1 Tax=Hymenobacter perfusus TaxID=1236770 RepID=A0A3R9UXN2_9BACT|nr:energy transducer TonB [Hymenobacter perfusus]RSK42356.1 hypothetical protein EI293_15670 [Hymenobacter perfusus]
MKPILRVVTLALLFVGSSLPIYAQKKISAEKLPESTDANKKQKTPPELLGNPGPTCTCFVPCPAIDSLQATYVCVEQMPIPPGGNAKAYLNTLAGQVQVPINQSGLEGRVWVYFVVTPTGELTDFKISKGLSPAYNAEAIRVIKAQPAWSPGYQSGQAVRVQILAYVQFRSQ